MVKRNHWVSRLAGCFNFGWPVLWLAVALSVASLSWAQSEITVSHAQGVSTLSSNPRKVAVYDLASLETLSMLGVGVSAVPTTPLPASLSRYADKRYHKVGTLFEPDYEAVYQHQPELIIVAERSAPKYASLAKLAPTIDLTVDRNDLVASIEKNTQTLGQIFQKDDAASELLTQLHESLAAVRQQAANAGNGLILLTVGGKLSAYGPGSRFGVIHDVFGLTPAVASLDTSNHGQAVSFEFIREHNPDWLFVIDRDAAIGREGASAKQLLDNPLIRQTNAWKNNRLVFLNNANWYLLATASASSLQAAAAEIQHALADRL